MVKKDKKIQEDDNDKLLLGGILRTGYEIFKSNLKSKENESIFDFVESLGGNARKVLEEDPKYQKIYQGADIVRKGKELWNDIKKLISE